MAYGILLGLLRALWILGESSGLFGKPPDAWIGTVSDLLAYSMYLYTALGVLILVEVYRRLQSDQNERITPLLLNLAGVLLMLAFTERVAYVASYDAKDILIWAGWLRDGLIRGGVYALIALGYTLVYGILFMINFAHGEVMMFGAYGGFIALQLMLDGGTRSFEAGAASIAIVIVPIIIGIMFLPLETLLQGYNQRKEINFQMPQWIFTFGSAPVRFAVGVAIGYGALVGLGGYAPHVYLLLITVVGVGFMMLCGMATSTLLAILLERVAYRPLRKAPRLAPLISAIGASIFLQQVALRMFGPNPKGYVGPRLLNDPVTFTVSLGDLGNLSISKTGVLIVIVSLSLMFVLYMIVNRTKMGMAMRAVAEDKNTAALMGVNVDRVIVFTFMLGAALAGAGGVLLGLRGDDLQPRFGFSPGLKAFTAAVLGGIGSIPGAMFGGFFLGIVEALGPGMLGFDFKWQNAIAFSLLVLVLIFRPTGILGGKEAVKKV
jgi:branched-chain amino acid transport system permease protein